MELCEPSSTVVGTVITREEDTLSDNNLKFPIEILEAVVLPLPKCKVSSPYLLLLLK